VRISREVLIHIISDHYQDRDYLPMSEYPYGNAWIQT
jgi:hypothetical protein